MANKNYYPLSFCKKITGKSIKSIVRDILCKKIPAYIYIRNKQIVTGKCKYDRFSPPRRPPRRRSVGAIIWEDRNRTNLNIPYEDIIVTEMPFHSQFYFRVFDLCQIKVTLITNGKGIKLGYGEEIELEIGEDYVFHDIGGHLNAGHIHLIGNKTKVGDIIRLSRATLTFISEIKCEHSFGYEQLREEDVSSLIHGEKEIEIEFLYHPQESDGYFKCLVVDLYNPIVKVKKHDLYLKKEYFDMLMDSYD